jgi:ferredoxin-NADP reductase
MARAAVRGRLNWQVGTVVDLVDESTHVRSIVLELPDWAGHRAGQHVDVRLTAEDGYQAQRSYSIASSPEDGQVVLTVEVLDDGEVSPYLAGELQVGDQLELRGPIGGYFVWTADLGGPVQLFAGGSGVVPFRAMLRHRAAANGGVPIKMLYSARRLDDVIYRDELAHLAASDETDIRFTLTREWPDRWSGYRRRVDREMVEQVAWSPEDRPLVYVCGPNGFVEAVADAMVELGHDQASIRTERFGPSGG